MNLKQLRELALKASEMDDDAMCDLQFQGDTILALLDLVDLHHECLVESVDLVQNDYDSDWRHGIPTRQKQLDGAKTLLDAHKKALAAYDNFNKEQ